MARFRTSHSRKRHGVLSGTMRMVVILAFLLAGLVFAGPLIKRMFIAPQDQDYEPDDVFYLPATNDQVVYHKKHYTLSYDEVHEQAKWVAYELTREQLNARKVKRSDYFKEDLSIKTGSASFYDYKNSGYTKGHLVPAADRGYSIEAMEETFLMSNMSPQTYHCNGGIWRELEEQVRDWARKFKALYVVSGPIFYSESPMTIGKNGVGVPDAFFKVLLDLSDPEIKGIGFVIPNDISYDPLSEYTNTIREIEEKTGLDFFHELLTDKLEAEIEENLDFDLWPISEKRFQTRTYEWNKR
ncbi:MAG: DNA/RNA non-specific endonuclease [Saprospiraceae bacterium]|nr:DNA/RNA non-specific endonuclease [Saprospiraceae bacterium]